MKKSRWEEITKLYHAALELPESERAAFLDACVDDDLRHEVSSLLENEGKADDLLETSALDAVARIRAKERSSLIGRQLASYQLISELGKGGMGEVYLAMDQKLGRDVAVKMLPEEFAHDADRVARFQREAKLLASLNHPNIASIYDLEESDGTHFLVLELVKGDTLADMIKSRPIPVEESLKLALQIAEALEAAHEKGVVHRDLKPANIMITTEEKVKILDFGLAKALADETKSIDSSQSPTIKESTTQPGLVLGTAPYMSPEQARGNAVDKRADIWAFGCCLYESLSGRAAFHGKTASDTVAVILKEDPDWQSLPDDTPPGILNLLRRCLAKDLNHRLQHIGDARIEIEEAIGLQSGTVSLKPEVPPKKAKSILVKTFIVLAVAAVLLGTGYWFLLRTNQSENISRLTIILPNGLLLAKDPIGIVISPDGKQVVFVATDNGTRQLYSRLLDTFEVQPIPRTEGAYSPFFSPDSQWIGFFAEDKVKKVKLSGGKPIILCNFENKVLKDDYFGVYSSCATWGTDKNIYITHSEKLGIWRVPEDCGVAEVVPGVKSQEGEIRYNRPQLLPDGDTLLFSATTGGGFENDRIVAVSLNTGDRTTLIEESGYGYFVESGYLLYLRGETLMAAPFDVRRLEVWGSGVPVLQSKEHEVFMPVNFSVSDQGTFAYVPRQSVAARDVVWVDRQGNIEPIVAEPRAYLLPSISPDGRYIALTSSHRTMETWILDLQRGSMSPFEQNSHFSVWTPDGKRIVFSSDREGPSHNLFWRNADGSGAVERLTTVEEHQDPASWTPDGKVLAFAQEHSDTNWDIRLLDIERRRQEPFQNSDFNESHPMISPDGRWIAYVSDELGENEVYVESFPDGGSKERISTDGGNDPLWSHDGKELFYRDGDNVFAVSVETEPAFEAKKTELLFKIPTMERTGWGHPNYDVTEDGQHFAMILPKIQPSPKEIHVVQNWIEDLKRMISMK